MNILKILCAIACLALHASAIISSEQQNSSSNALFSIIAKQNHHYQEFEKRAQNATVTITSSPNKQPQGTLTLENDPSKTFPLSPDTLNNLLMEWNYEQNSTHNVSLWRLIITSKNIDLTVRLHSPSPDKIKELNHIQNLINSNKSKDIKQNSIQTLHPGLIFVPKQPSITQKHFSVSALYPAPLCRFCDTSE